MCHFLKLKHKYSNVTLPACQLHDCSVMWNYEEWRRNLTYLSQTIVPKFLHKIIVSLLYSKFSILLHLQGNSKERLSSVSLFKLSSFVLIQKVAHQLHKIYYHYSAIFNSLFKSLSVSALI